VQSNLDGVTDRDVGSASDRASGSIGVDGDRDGVAA
jgi:hypothetical protein